MQILWIPINKLSYKDFLEEITRIDKKSIIFTPNPEIILKTLEDEEFKKMIINADYLLPDGTGLYIAAQINNIKEKYIYILWVIISIILLPYFIFNVIFRKKVLYKLYWDKICWSDLTLDLLKFAENNNVKVTIIDLYTPNDERKVAVQNSFREKLNSVYKNLTFDYFIYNEIKKEEIIENIKNSNSKILFSTLWMKKQEESVIEIMGKCDNLKIWTWIWSSFDYITWFQKRASGIWRYLWLEWLYRLITWPQKTKRLKRLYMAIIVFLYKVIITK